MRNLQARRRALRGRYRGQSALRASSSPPGWIDGDEKGAIDESGRMAASDVRARSREPDRLLRVYLRLRGHLKGFLMTFVTIAVTAFVIVYLFVALVRPEWF
jgi:F subunit of K+-transporting ATPase (Potass_KdpF)